MTRDEKDILEAKNEKFVEEVTLPPKLKAIKKSLWDQTFDIFPSLFDQVDYHLEFDDLQKGVQKHLDQLKEELAHKAQVVGVVLKAVNFLPIKTSVDWEFMIELHSLGMWKVVVRSWRIGWP